MFDDLDRVPWDRLTHAYGTAEDVPGQLRALTSPDGPERDEALWELYGNIFHQGTRYEASAPAVRFLFEVAAAPEGPGNTRAQVVGLLTHLALGYPDEYLPDGVDPTAAFGTGEAPPLGWALEIYRRDHDDLTDAEKNTWEAAHTPWMRLAYEAVEVRADALVALLDDADLDVRLQTWQALSFLPRRAAIVLPALRARLTNAYHPLERAAALIAAGLLARSEEGSVARLWLQEADAASPVEYVALAIARATANVRVEEALPILLAVLHEDGEGADRLPWHDGDLKAYIGRLLAARTSLPEVTESRDALLRRLAHELPGVAPMTNLSLTEALLQIMFPGGYAPKRPFSPGETDALRAIARHGAWKVGGAIHANYDLLMRGFGLPGTAVGLDAFLATPEPPRHDG